MSRRSRPAANLLCSGDTDTSKPTPDSEQELHPHGLDCPCGECRPTDVPSKKIKPSDIITKGWLKLGYNPDQAKNPIHQRGWFVYPDPGEGMIEVILVKLGEKK